jgi:diguanylate cyclase (GGDEF)-like protein
LGHNVGDKVLQIFAGHLERVFPKNEKTMIARLGGDEFTILMLDTMPNFVESLCTQLTESLAKPVLIEDKNVLIRTAYGIANLNNHSSLEELAICADKELYKHKEKTKRDK